MTGPAAKRISVTRVGVMLIMTPVFAIVGVFVAVAFFPRAVRWLKNLPAFWAASLACPNGHANAVAARWECVTCHGQYLGWVGRCEICGSEADWFPCETCELAVVLPWRKFE
ncbi:MAG: hypothetical protein WCG85_04600 [Polyangia bacterium]